MTVTANKKYQIDSQHGPNFILDVENFGPIAEAKNIEFKPMTVFVGPSNTGKTYLAMLLYAMMQAGTRRYRYHFSRDIRSFVINYEEQIKSILEDIETQIVATEDLSQSSYISTEINIDSSKLSQTSREFIEKIYSSWVSTFCKRAAKSITNYFAVQSIEELTSSGISTPDPATIRITLSDTVGHLRASITENDFSRLQVNMPLIFRGTNIDRFMHSRFMYSTELNKQRRVRRSLDTLSIIITESIERFLPAFRNSIYLPASRGGIITSHRILTFNVLDNIHEFGLRELEVPTFSRIAIDFLRLLIGIEETHMRAYSTMNHVADAIENSVIDGTVEVSKQEFGIPDFKYASHGSVTPLERSSSMATEIAPIVLFLRNYTKQGDLLIIDEPEAHLHPEAQQHMAAALAFMVRSGLRVLITTHSHYMVEQLSAFVNASILDSETRRKTLDLPGILGQEDVFLSESETAVYGFNRNDHNARIQVKPIPLNEDYEYSPIDHSLAVTSQYNRLQRVLEAREEIENDGLASNLKEQIP